MSELTIFEELAIPNGSDLLTLEKALLDKIQNKIQQVVETYDVNAIREEEKEIRHYFHLFFDHTNSLITGFAGRPVNKAEPAEVRKLREQASELLGEIENNLIEFALCYMHINRNTTLVREEIRKEEKYLNAGQKKIVWTSDMDIAIRRLKKRKKEIDEEDKRLANAYLIIERAAPHFNAFSDALAQIASGEDREKLSRSFTSGLRTGKFAKAEKALKEIESYKKKFALKGAPPEKTKAAIEAGKRFKGMIVENKDELDTGESRIFLHPAEIRMKLDSNDHELKNIRKYMAKYHMPYMEGKLASLNRLRDKLLVIGTLDSLMRLYLRLIRGLTEPMTDFPTIREYESGAIDQAKYLSGSRFSDIPVIRSDSEKIVAVFQREIARYKTEYKADPEQDVEPAREKLAKK